MHSNYTHTLILAVATATLAGAADAQIARTRSPAGGDATLAAAGIPRDSKFPYAGAWHGTRTMPVGSDELRFRFTVADGRYSGVTIHPGGGTAPQNNLTATSAGLTWDQPNSGGGTWVFQVRLAGPDSMVGTIVLRDAPANFNPVPRGTLVLTRVPANAARQR